MNLATEPAEMRRDAFTIAGERRGLLPLLIEKDFWVCWTLERLFALPEFRGHLLFKGGTSLSKVYGLIQRFSEDIDLSLSRSALGEGLADPEQAVSNRSVNSSLRHWSRHFKRPSLAAFFLLSMQASCRNWEKKRVSPGRWRKMLLTLERSTLFIPAQLVKSCHTSARK